MNQNTGRSSLLAIAGGYLIYLAYELLKNLIDNVPTTMPHWVAILAIAAFSGIGIALLVYAFIIWKRGRDDQNHKSAEPEGYGNDTESGDDNSLK